MPTLRLFEENRYIIHPSVTSAYEWQVLIQVRLEPWPAARIGVATVAKVRNTERYTIVPALRFAETCGHGHTLGSMREVRAHLRKAIQATNTA